MTSIEDERRHLMDLWKATGTEAFLRAASCLSDDRAGSEGLASSIHPSAGKFTDLPTGRTRGRPEDPDLGALIVMACLFVKDPSRSVQGAAREVASHMSEQHSLDATVERLRKKFKAHREKLVSLGQTLVAIELTLPMMAEAGAAIERSRPAFAAAVQDIQKFVAGINQIGVGLAAAWQRAGLAGKKSIDE